MNRLLLEKRFAGPIGIAILVLLGVVVWARGEKVVAVAGGGQGIGPIDATKGALVKPFAVAFDRQGNMYIGEFEGCRVRKVDSNGVLTTLAGTGEKGFGGDDGPAIDGKFNLIHDVVVGRDGNVYVADSDNRRVRKIDLKTGVLSTVVGTGEKGLAGDGGYPERATLDGVASLWFDPTEQTLYVSGFSKVVRAVDFKARTIATVKDLPGGRSIAVDSKGNLYVAGGQTLRVRTPDGKTQVLLDKTHTGGAAMPLGDNPKHLGIDANDNVVICDEQRNLIRRYIPAQEKLETIAGTGEPGSAGVGGPPAQLQINRPHGVYFHPADGFLYIADSWNDRVLRIEP